MLHNYLAMDMTSFKAFIITENKYVVIKSILTCLMEETSTQQVGDSNFDHSGPVENYIGEPIVGKNSHSTSATRSVYLITYSQADLQKFTC